MHKCECTRLGMCALVQKMFIQKISIKTYFLFPFYINEKKTIFCLIAHACAYARAHARACVQLKPTHVHVSCVYARTLVCKFSVEKSHHKADESWFYTIFHFDDRGTSLKRQWRPEKWRHMKDKNIFGIRRCSSMYMQIFVTISLAVSEILGGRPFVPPILSEHLKSPYQIGLRLHEAH